MPTRRAITLPPVAPIVPVLRDQPFDDPAYLFEPKYDGESCGHATTQDVPAHTLGG